MRMKRLREKAFGGKAGIWIHKARKTYTADGSVSKTNGALITRDAFVEWDDDLCRPIYRKDSSDTWKEEDVKFRSPSTVAIGSSDEELESVTKAQTSSEQWHKKKSAPHCVHTGFTPCQITHKSIRRGFFGSQRPRTQIINSDMRSHRPSTPPKLQAATNMETNTIFTHNSDHSPREQYITDKYNVHGRKDLSNARRNRCVEPTVVESVSIDSKYGDCNHDNLRSFPVQQPSSTTDLSLARSFFHHLDASVSLVIEPAGRSPPSSMSSVGVVRTRRKISPINPKIEAEYANYKQVCLQTPVEPLTMHQFAELLQISASIPLYDGFLDE